MDASTILPEDSSSEMTTKEWVQFSKDIVFTFADKERILAGEKLDNHYINLAQNTLKQFSGIGGHYCRQSFGSNVLLPGLLPSLLPSFLYSCKIKSGSGLRTRLITF